MVHGVLTKLDLRIPRKQQRAMFKIAFLKWAMSTSRAIIDKAFQCFKSNSWGKKMVLQCVIPLIWYSNYSLKTLKIDNGKECVKAMLM